MIPQTLINRLKEGKVIPFVGAGVSMAVRDKQGNRLFPSWVQLLEHASEKLKQENKAREGNYVSVSLSIDDRDLLKTAEYAKKHLGPCWYDLLRDRIDPRRDLVEDESLLLARLIWELGSDLIITTNYDRVLEWCCPDVRKDDFVGWNIQAIAEQAELMKKGRVDRPTAWHLHGKITDASNLILTPDGYHKLYDQNNEESYKAALHTLRSLLASHTMLFIGFSMEDHYVGVQLRGIQEIFEGASAPHYVLVREQERSQILESGLMVEPVTFSDFGEPLIDLLKELSSHRADSTLTLHTDANQQAIATTSLQRVPDAHAPADYNPANRVFNVPFRPKGDQVIGRDEALQQVRDQLTQGKHTAIGHTASFEGLGGLGKTQLAVEYAYRFNDSYPNGVIWINADQDINAQLTDIAVTARWIAPETEHKLKLDVALHRLRSLSDCLIIFDNVDDFAAIGPFFPLPTATPHLLATSRSSLTDFKPIHLYQLDEGQSLQLLFQEAERQAIGDVETEAAENIVEQLDGLPLALELAGAYLCRRSTMSFVQYRDKLLSDPIKTLSCPYLSSFTKHDADLLRTLKIDEDVVQDEPLLTVILDTLTWSGPAAMGLSLMSALLGKKESELSGALSLGTQLKLLQKKPDEERYALHRLVREVRRCEQPLVGRDEWVIQLCERLGDWFEGLREDFIALPRFESEIDHLMAWRDNAEHTVPLHACRLTWLQAYPAYHRGMYRESHDHLFRSKEIFENASLVNIRLRAHLLNDLSTIASLLGQYSSAHDYAEKALLIRRDAFGENNSDTALTYHNLGICSGELGDNQKALSYLKKSLNIFYNLFGEHNHHYARAYNHVGTTYNRLGDYVRALTHQEIALKIRLELYGEYHPDTACSYNDIGNTYNRMKSYDKSLDCYNKAISILIKLFGAHHLYLAVSYNGIGTTYVNMGENKKALEYLQKALNLYRNLIGEFHQDTAMAYNNIGTTYENLGISQIGFDCKKRAFEIRQIVLGEQHPDTIKSYHDISLSYFNLNEYSTAKQLLRKGYDLAKAHLPPKHPIQEKFERGIRAVSEKMYRPGFRKLPLHPKKNKKK